MYVCMNDIHWFISFELKFQSGLCKFFQICPPKSIPSKLRGSNDLWYIVSDALCIYIYAWYTSIYQLWVLKFQSGLCKFLQNLSLWHDIIAFLGPESVHLNPPKTSKLRGSNDLWVGFGVDVLYPSTSGFYATFFWGGGVDWGCGLGTCCRGIVGCWSVWCIFFAMGGVLNRLIHILRVWLSKIRGFNNFPVFFS